MLILSHLHSIITFGLCSSEFSVHFLRRIVVDCLPSFVRRTPVVSSSDPASVATVQVPGVVVTEDHLVVLVNKFPDDVILSCCPDLNDIVLIGQISFNVTLKLSFDIIK